MEPLESQDRFVSIIEIKYVGRFCIKCVARIDRETGRREVTFRKWINGRFVVAQRKLMPGYWAAIHFADLELRHKLALTFAHMLEGPKHNETL